MKEYAQIFGNLMITLDRFTTGEIEMPDCTKGLLVIKKPLYPLAIFSLYKGTTKLAENGFEIHMPIEKGNDYRLVVKSNHPERDTFVFNIQYMSAFPIIEKKIPFKFFDNAFDEYWNNNPIFEIIGDKNEDSFSLKFSDAFADGFEIEPTMKIADVKKINAFSYDGIIFKMKEIKVQNNVLPAINITISGLKLDVKYSIARVKADRGFEINVALNPLSYYDHTKLILLVPEVQNKIRILFNTISVPKFIEDIDALIQSKSHEVVSRIKDLLNILYRWLFGGDENNVPHAQFPVDVREFYAKNQNIIVKYVSEHPDPLLYIPQIGTPTVNPGVGFGAPRSASLSDDVSAASGSSSGDPTENMKKIKHIVVLMMENRSFDHMLGYLSHMGTSLLERRTDVDGLTGQEYNRWRGKTFKVNQLTNSKITHSPGHQTEDVLYQQMATVEGVPMGGFAASFGKRYGEEVTNLVMGYYRKSKVPIYDYLAREFSICDRWFCSHPGGTLPNRFVTLTGDLTNKPNGQAQIDNMTNKTEFYPERAKTIFDYLNEKGVKWNYFEHGYCTLRLFKNYTFDVDRILNIKKFYEKCENGSLPPVSFVDPDFIEYPPGADDHAPSDIADGQAFIRRVIKALQSNKDQWEETLLIITYDEHGGFYDHVVPPLQAPLKSTIEQLGPRVPTFFVSPWIKRGGVSHTEFDHTAITSAILRRFYGSIPNSMSQRVKEAKDVFALLLDEVRSDVTTLEEWEVRLSNSQQIYLQKPSGARRIQKAQITVPKHDENDFHDVLSFARLFLGWPST